MNKLLFNLIGGVNDPYGFELEEKDDGPGMMIWIIVLLVICCLCSSSSAVAYFFRDKIMPGGNDETIV